MVCRAEFCTATMFGPFSLEGAGARGCDIRHSRLNGRVSILVNRVPPTLTADAPAPSSVLNVNFLLYVGDWPYRVAKWTGRNTVPTFVSKAADN